MPMSELKVILEVMEPTYSPITVPILIVVAPIIGLHEGTQTLLRVNRAIKTIELPKLNEKAISLPIVE